MRKNNLSASSRQGGFTQHHFRSGRLGSQIKKHKSGAGFTLIELLVVIAIIGLLSTLAVVALNSARLKARDAKRIDDVKQIQTVLEFYFNDSDSYPYDGGGGGYVLGVDVTCLGSGGFLAAGCSSPIYMGLVPSNPTPNGTAYTYNALSAGSGCTGADC